MKTFFTILGGILLALSIVTTSDARPHNKRLGPNRNEALYYEPDYNFEPGQKTTRGLDSCTVWGHHIYPCE